MTAIIATVVGVIISFFILITLMLHSFVDDELAEIARQEEAERIRKEQEELAKKIKEEKLKLETLKQEEEVDNIIIETDLETQEKVIINVHE